MNFAVHKFDITLGTKHHIALTTGNYAMWLEGSYNALTTGEGK